MRRPYLAIAVATLSLSACATMGTRDALVSDRPDFTEATVVVDPGQVQVESGSTVSREGETRATAFGEVLVRAGLAPKVELRVAGNSFVRERTAGVLAQGMEDATLGFKFKLLEGPETRSWKPELSVITHTTVPSGARLYRSQRAQPEVKVLTAWSLTDRLGFSSNVNIGRPFDGVRSFTEYAASGSFGYAATGRVGVYAEAFAFAPQDGSNVVSKYVNSGFTFLFSPDVQLDVRGGLGPIAGKRDYFAGVGLVVRR
ncbi:transporter [Gemmatimonas sp.]